MDFLDSSSRSTFRSSLNQPPQMGNFKHQSLRGNDRDGDKDKERDIRDKEGQERLRNVSRTLHILFSSHFFALAV